VPAPGVAGALTVTPIFIQLIADDMFARFQFGTKTSQQRVDISGETCLESSQVAVLRDAHAFEVGAKSIPQGADIGGEIRHKDSQLATLPRAKFNA
jgi:hypothetical protein